MLNKKGFIVAPIIFIVFFLIAVVFSFYVSSIDNEIARGIQTSASIQLGIYEIEKGLINQENFVRIAMHENIEEYDIEYNLNNTFGEHVWKLSIIENGFEFSSKPINATNINMNLNSSKIEGEILDIK